MMDTVLKKMNLDQVMEPARDHSPGENTAILHVVCISVGIVYSFYPFSKLVYYYKYSFAEHLPCNSTS